MLVVNKKFRKISDLAFDKGTDRIYVTTKPNYYKKYYSWLTLGSSFRMGELNASYLQPQIKDINSVISYRSQLYKRYLKNFIPWSKDYFSILIKLSIFINIIITRLQLF